MNSCIPNIVVFVVNIAIIYHHRLASFTGIGIASIIPIAAANTRVR